MSTPAILLLAIARKKVRRLLCIALLSKLFIYTVPFAHRFRSTVQSQPPCPRRDQYRLCNQRSDGNYTQDDNKLRPCRRPRQAACRTCDVATVAQSRRSLLILVEALSMPTKLQPKLVIYQNRLLTGRT